MEDGLAFCWQNLSLYVTVKKKKLLGKTETRRLKLLNNGKHFIYFIIK